MGVQNPPEHELKSYQMLTKGPRNIDLLSIMAYRLPLPGIVSILHRISGFALFLLIPLFLYGLQCSLSSPQAFDQLRLVMQHFVVKLFVWLCLAGLIYHWVAGIRHLLMDFGYGETLVSAQWFAKATLAISIVLVVWLGIWIF